MTRGHAPNDLPGGLFATDDEIATARSRLLHALEQGWVHIHYTRGAGRDGRIFTLSTSPGDHNPICGTNRCTPIPKNGSGLKGGL